jgi:mono/diheme cytochrome c family protein
MKSLDRVLSWVTWIAAGALVVMLFAGPILIAEDEAPIVDPEPVAGEEGSGGTRADGEALFAERCGGCHTLEAAGTTGAIGPNLDDAGVDAEKVTEIVTNGSGGMPSFGDELDEAEIQAIAEFVAGSSGS